MALGATLPVLAAMLAGAGVALFMVGTVGVMSAAGQTARDATERRSAIDAWNLRGPIAVVLALLGPRLQDQRRMLDGLLAIAGRPWSGMTGDEYLALGLLAVGGATLAGAAAGALLGPLAAMAAAMGCAGLTLFLWWRKLAGLAEERQTQTWREFPFFLDSLVMTMQAGATLVRSLEIYQASHPQAELTGDIVDALRRVALGGSLRESIAEMLHRIAIEDVRLTFEVLLQAKDIGNNPLRVLRERAYDLRQRRWEMVEKTSQELQSKLALPTMFIMIAVLLLVLTPALIGVMQSGLF